MKNSVGTPVWFFLICLTVSGHVTAKVSDEDDIREAVFRYQFWTYKTPHIHFLSIDKDEKKQDPSEHFLKRFADLKVRIKKISAAIKIPQDGSVRCKDKETGEPGMLYQVHLVRMISEGVAEAEGLVYSDINFVLGITNATYSVFRQKGKWEVTETTGRRNR